MKKSAAMVAAIVLAPVILTCDTPTEPGFTLLIPLQVRFEVEAQRNSNGAVIRSPDVLYMGDVLLRRLTIYNPATEDQFVTDVGMAVMRIGDDGKPVRWVLLDGEGRTRITSDSTFLWEKTDTITDKWGPIGSEWLVSVHMNGLSFWATPFQICAH